MSYANRGAEGWRGTEGYPGAFRTLPGGYQYTAMHLQPASVRKYDGISDAPGLNNFADALTEVQTY